MAGVGHGYGRRAAKCQDCGKVPDRNGTRCIACHIEAKRARWRRQDALERALEKKAARQAQSEEPEVVPAHKIHGWMMAAVI